MGNVMKTKKTGFTMVELLVVLVIVAILAAVAAPIYMANVKRSMASDAVAMMSSIRQAERERIIKSGAAIQITDSGIYTLNTSLGFTSEVKQYFAPGSFRVDITPVESDFTAQFSNPNPVDFVITASGNTTAATVFGANKACSSSILTDCALKVSSGNSDDLSKMRLMMDNAGRIQVSYDSGSTWENY
jgi:prepilin-type N-terminal cleavage/methylation domain-containing protein